MQRKIAIALRFVLISAILPLSAGAWNAAAHMITGAIAYLELKDSDPVALQATLDLLHAHPDFQARWGSRLAQPFLRSQRDRDLYTFMLAARWADDVRGEDFDRPAWHYINLPFKPAGQPATVTTQPPAQQNLLRALQQNDSTLRTSAESPDRSIALRWLFHLIGDVQQPLHVARLFTTTFPNGDRGGTLFFVRVGGSGRTISLHSLWDGLVQGSTRFREVRNTAIRLRARHKRANLPELAITGFQDWIEKDGFPLAKSVAYRDGALKGGSQESNGAVLPGDYTKVCKPVAERRVVLGGYRLADVLALAAANP